MVTILCIKCCIKRWSHQFKRRTFISCCLSENVHIPGQKNFDQFCRAGKKARIGCGFVHKFYYLDNSVNRDDFTMCTNVTVAAELKLLTLNVRERPRIHLLSCHNQARLRQWCLLSHRQFTSNSCINAGLLAPIIGFGSPTDRHSMDNFYANAPQCSGFQSGSGQRLCQRIPKSSK